MTVTNNLPFTLGTTPPRNSIASAQPSMSNLASHIGLPVSSTSVLARAAQSSWNKQKAKD